jgi:N-acetylglucosaminyldiphosphoundecaprenol N-acetyl-beta-D-mannosaminyltransferase
MSKSENGVLNIKRFLLEKIEISLITKEQLIEYIKYLIKNSKNGYICITNSRTAYLSSINQEYCLIQNNSLLTIPDGKPIVWIAHNFGYKNITQIAGIEFMELVFNLSSKYNISHYFYGGTSKSINLMVQKIKLKYPKLNILGYESPPFQAVEQFNLSILTNKLNELNPIIFWCGLGAPKQEIIISKIQSKLPNTICVGVGLAFDYYAGLVKRAPKVLRIFGLEWLYTIIQQPKKITRIIKPYIWILKLLFKSYFKIKI